MRPLEGKILSGYLRISPDMWKGLGGRWQERYFDLPSLSWGPPLIFKKLQMLISMCVLQELGYRFIFDSHRYSYIFVYLYIYIYTYIYICILEFLSLCSRILALRYHSLAVLIDLYWALVTFYVKYHSIWQYRIIYEYVSKRLPTWGQLPFYTFLFNSSDL